MTGQFRRISRRTHSDARGTDLFPDWRLPPKLETLKPAVAQLAPEESLGRGLLAAQLTSAVQKPAVAGHGVASVKIHPPSPCPLPRKAGGEG